MVSTSVADISRLDIESTARKKHEGGSGKWDAAVVIEVLVRVPEFADGAVNVPVNVPVPERSRKRAIHGERSVFHG
jgi:hypothetical protein